MPSGKNVALRGEGGGGGGGQSYFSCGLTIHPGADDCVVRACCECRLVGLIGNRGSHRG